METAIGVDAHKSTHTFVAVDDVGRKVDELTAKATPDGHLTVIEWTAAMSPGGWKPTCSAAAIE